MLSIWAVWAAVGTAAWGQVVPVSSPNLLSLSVGEASRYVRPAEPVIIDLDVANLAQMVNGCQALIGYDSTFLTAPHAVSPGGGYWTELIYESWLVAGELDTAIGIELQGGPTGTDEDATVAVISMTAGSTEGSTLLVFRPDVSAGYATMLSDLAADPVWPVKFNSPTIIIDGTAPATDIAHAIQSGQELLVSLGSTTNALQGTVTLKVSSVDPLAGLLAEPAVAVYDSANALLAVTYTGQSPAGTFNYTVQIDATAANGLATVTAAAADMAGNIAIDADSFWINKSQISGTIESKTLSGSAFAFDRYVVFKATNSAGTVLKSWNVLVHFTNSPATKVASGSYLLTDVPAGASRLSAKTLVSLRRRQAVTLDVHGQCVLGFTVAAGKALLGGDVNGNNIVNLPDYSALKAGWNTINPALDVNGDGPVQLLDYSLMKENWLTAGDPE